MIRPRREPLDLWQKLERVLIAGEPLPDDLRDRLSLVAQAIIHLADDRLVAPRDAAADIARLAGLTGADIKAYRLSRRERCYGEAFEFERRLLKKGRKGFTGETKLEFAADKLGEWAAKADGKLKREPIPGKKGRTIQRWAAKLPEHIKRLIASRTS